VIDKVWCDIIRMKFGKWFSEKELFHIIIFVNKFECNRLLDI